MTVINTSVTLELGAWRLRGGVNNALDKDPPIVTAEITAGGAANTYEFYDLYGRQLFIAMNVAF